MACAPSPCWRETLKSFLAALALVGAGSASAIAFSSGEPARTPQSQAEVGTETEPSAEETRKFFLEDALAPTVKPAGYDVTIVEYTDYQCPVCRTSHDALMKLVAADKKVRIIYRDWPIFGPQSRRAARLAIASQWQNKHASFHDALMKSPRPLSEQSIKAAAIKAGVDWAKLESDLKTRGSEVDNLLERNDAQAIQLDLAGTPGFIVEDTLYAGVLDLKDLKEAVAIARKSAKPKNFIPPKPEGI